MKKGSVVLFFILLLFSNSCTPCKTITYTHPKESEDAVLIYQSSNDVVTMSVFGGRSEIFNGYEWYITAGNRNLISIVIELNTADENLWLESINLSTIDSPITVEVLNHKNGKWKNPGKDKPCFVVFQAQIDAPALTTTETIFNISADITLAKEMELWFFSRKKKTTTRLSEAVSAPVRGQWDN